MTLGAWRLTELSNVVAYVCRPYEKRIGIMCIFSPVILSEAKACPERSRRDLVPVASGESARFGEVGEVVSPMVV